MQNFFAALVLFFTISQAWGQVQTATNSDMFDPSPLPSALGNSSTGNSTGTSGAASPGGGSSANVLSIPGLTVGAMNGSALMPMLTPPLPASISIFNPGSTAMALP